MTLLEKMAQAYLLTSGTSHDQAKAALEVVLDDMREWANKKTAHSDYESYQLLEFGELLDAYEKDRNKTEYERTFGNPPPPSLKGY